MNLELTGMMPVKFCCLLWVVIPNLLTLQCSPQQHSDLQKCNISHAANETTVDCSRCGFNRVPRGFPRNTTELYLGNNNLSSLSKGSLPYLPSLHTLLVNDNNLEFLEEGALQNLPALRRLNLDGNRFNFTYSSLPLGTFQNLTSLTTLRLSRMKMQFSSLTYPDATFADLHYLESLVIDGPEEPVFGPGFAQLKRLQSLSFGSPCLIRRLGKGSFVNFREAPVSNLSLSGCYDFISLDDNVYLPFPYLRFLFARDTTPFGLHPSLLSLKGMSGRNMTEIDFSHVKRYDTTIHGVMHNQTLVLTSEMTRYLVTICVERLILRDNNIVVIETIALFHEPFQSCLRYFDLRQNAVVGEPSLLFYLPEFYNLVVLDVSEQSHHLYLRDGQDQHSKDVLGESLGNMTFYLPPLLETLLLSGSGSHERHLKGTNICFHGGEHLTYLDLSYSALITNSGHIYGVKHVKYLDFTGNFFQKIPLTFFQSFPNVMILYLNNVHFDTDLMSNVSSQTLFSPLENVRSLDISFNSLHKMYTHIFRDLKTLKCLNLSHNVFEDVPIELSGMLNITHIDLSFNSIGVLSTNTRTMLDERVFDSQQISLDLHGNILSCGCAALDFLTWIIDTDVQFRRFDSYSCLNTDIHSQLNETDQVDTVSSSTDASRQSRSRPGPFLVKMTFPNKQRKPKRSCALKRANTKVKELTDQLSSYKKKQQKWKKRYQRMKAKYGTSKQTSRNNTENSSDQTTGSLQQQSEATPSTKTRHDLRENGVSPSHLPATVVRQLTMANVLFGEIKESVAANKKQSKMNVMTSLVGGKVLKKYRCVSGLNKATGLSRRSLSRTTSKVIEIRGRARLTLVREQIKRLIVSFMERDDISVCMPGKADSKSLNGVKHQTRIMNDYLSEVYAKFKIENQNMKLSFASFCRLRPRYILLTSHISRNTYLCNKHQNMAMKLKCLRSVGLQVPKSPDMAYDSVSVDAMDQMLETIQDDVEYDEWRRVDVEGKKKMKVVKIIKNATDFKNYMLLEFAEFRDHVGRVKSQYAAIHELKDTLPDGHIIIQMDFAENFTCSSMDEIQSAYWNPTNVTLHPVVVYYKLDKLVHKNFIYVSDVNQHNSTAVLTILKRMLPELKTTFPDATHVHYWTDSPSSQYRNRYMFDVILKHKELFGLEALVGRFLAAIYDGNWFIGKVLEVDIDDGDTKITFMEKTQDKGKTYKWPSRPDEIWIEFDDVLCFIDEPVAIGKTRRQYNLRISAEGQLIKLSNITSSYGRHWRYCSARSWLAFSVCLMCVLISGLVICHLILKNAISLKYWMLRLIAFDYCVPCRQDYQYDIFIYYSQHDDYQWVCTTFLQKMEVERGLRLCIPDRDFEVGVCAAEEIINCIHNSWKTVLYVTETFLQDELCSFTLSSGIYACNNNMPKRLMLLYSDAILGNLLPPVLTQLLDGDGVFVLEDLEENNAWQRLFEHVLRWI
ncbi:uncharacterized protein LOC124116006 [Haliotis rufescens]|uniref:uncharacterized protein LOC124116006 n=1 Tax=Haliotis rufescens TaxID=6454 RepID=UPI00201F4A6B|nr:uncharacterized protein LOC124116006 [Haliotis rufescens]